jgi:hypothetical protein
MACLFVWILANFLPGFVPTRAAPGVGVAVSVGVGLAMPGWTQGGGVAAGDLRPVGADR